jgi:cytoskeletal protein CcmA (bactofilin family)
MFSKTATKPIGPGEPAAAPRKTAVASLVAEGVTIRGDLVTTGDLHLDGAVEGDVTVGRLTIGESGAVTGTIQAESVEVRGRISGSVSARQVRLCATARVSGDVSHAELAIDAGAHFEGRSLVFAPTAAPALEAPASLSVAAE